MALAFRFTKKLFLSKTYCIMSRNVATTSQLLNDAVEELRSNPYFDKYAGKIAELQKTSPEELLSRIEKKKQEEQKTVNTKEKAPLPSGVSKPILEKQPQVVKTKKLENYMKVELLANQTPDDVKQIWLDYHKDKDVIAAVIPKDTYLQMYKRGQEFNTFVLPLPRRDGYEFILCQFYGHEIHFTPLIAYQTHKENAPECLTMIHYTELVEDKNIVLMKGDYNTDVLQAHEAQCLINELQLYYAQNNEKRLNMLRRFTFSPEEFRHMDLIADMECLSIDDKPNKK